MCDQSSSFFSLDCEGDFLEMSGTGPAVLVGPGTGALSVSELDHHPPAVHACLTPSYPAFSSVKYGWDQDLCGSPFISGRDPGSSTPGTLIQLFHSHLEAPSCHSFLVSILSEYPLELMVWLLINGEGMLHLASFLHGLRRLYPLEQTCLFISTAQHPCPVLFIPLASFPLSWQMFVPVAIFQEECPKKEV